MATEEDHHHAEALRRIQEAEQTRAAQLDLRTRAPSSNGTENSAKAFSFLNTQSLSLLWR